jgi:hypothetical protein
MTSACVKQHPDAPASPNKAYVPIVYSGISRVNGTDASGPNGVAKARGNKEFVANATTLDSTGGSMAKERPPLPVVVVVGTKANCGGKSRVKSWCILDQSSFENAEDPPTATAAASAHSDRGVAAKYDRAVLVAAVRLVEE